MKRQSGLPYTPTPQGADNIRKLGYGGTKEEMQRLIDDANEWGRANGEASNLSMESFSDVVTAIEQIQKKQQIFGTSQKEALTTIEGSANAAKAAWSNLLTSIGSGDAAKIQENVNGIIVALFGTWDDELGKKTGGLVNNILPVVQNVADAVAQQIPGIAQQLGFQFVDLFLDAIGMEAGAHEDFIIGLEEKIDSFSSWLSGTTGKLKQTWDGFISGLTGSADLSGFGSGFEVVRTAFDSALSFIAEHSDEFGTTVGSVVTTIGGLVDSAVGFATSVRDGFLKTFDPSTISSAVEAFQPAVETIGGFVTQIGEFLSAHSGEIGEFLGNVANVLGTVAEAVGNVASVVSPFLPTILAVVGAVAGAVTAVGAVTGAIATVTGVIEAAIAAVTAAGGVIPAIVAALGGPVTIIASIIAAIVAFIATNEDARNAVLAAVDFIVTKFNEFKDAIGQKLKEVGDFFTNLGKGIQEKFNEAVEFVTGIPQRIKDALGDLGNLLKDAGISIITGLWNGLKEKWEEVTGWVGGIADWIGEHKGPKRYDLGLLVPNGKWIMQGLEDGLRKGLPSVEDTLGDITDSIQTGINTDVSVARATPQTDNRVVQLLTAILDKDQNVYLDSGRLVGGIAPQMDYAMGRL